MLIALVPVSYNVYKYVYHQERYKIWPVLSYYIQMYVYLLLLGFSYLLYCLDYSQQKGSKVSVPNDMLLLAVIVRYFLVISQA